MFLLSAIVYFCPPHPQNIHISNVSSILTDIWDVAVSETDKNSWLHGAWGLICVCKMQYASKSLQSCLTLCDPIDGSPPGSPVPGILQARTLEWVAISFSNAWKWTVKVKSLSRVRPSATPWTAAYQAPPSMGFSMQEYWSGVPSPSPKMQYMCV